MPELTIYTAIMAISALVIVSYVFSLISDKTRISTVLMLLFLGIAIREALIHLDMYEAVPLDIVQFFGVLGLILILLEAGLDLNMSREKLPLVRRSIASSVFVLALSTGGIAALIHFILEQAWQTSLVYAVPLSIISSTVVASSIDYLNEAKREFLTYESSLSDILGILLFNILIADQAIGFGLVAFSLGGIALAFAVSLAVSVGLLFLLARIESEIKAFLIFAVLLMLYAVGHIWHIPTLLAVLMFGLMINNWPRLSFAKAKKLIRSDEVSNISEAVKSVTAESAFLVRTFFFVLFGYTINVHNLFDSKVILVGTAIVLMIFLIRYLYLRIFLRGQTLPELFFAPRGLVTIVLFYSIPQRLTFGAFDDGILFYVIVLTTLVMMFGSMWFTPEESTREAEEESRQGKLRNFFSDNSVPRIGP